MVLLSLTNMIRSLASNFEALNSGRVVGCCWLCLTDPLLRPPLVTSLSLFLGTCQHIPQAQPQLIWRWSPEIGPHSRISLSRCRNPKAFHQRWHCGEDKSLVPAACFLLPKKKYSLVIPNGSCCRQSEKGSLSDGEQMPLLLQREQCTKCRQQ